MRMRLKSLARFTRQMATYQESFVDIRKALRSMSASTTDSRMSSSLGRVAGRIEDGESLFEAFSAEGDRYPLIFLRMTKVGEESGTLSVIYHQLADYLDQQVSMRRRFLLRLIYPAFMVIALIVVLSLINAVYSSMTPDGNVSMNAIEQAFVRNVGKYLLIVGSIVGAVILLRFLLAGRRVTDTAILFIPGLAGAFRKLMLYRFSLSMYLMTGSAIGMPEAVRESGKATNNAFAAWLLGKAAERLEDGVPLTEALKQANLFPPDFIDIMEVAEESGTVSESLRRVAPHYAEDAEIAMNRIVSAVAWGAYLTVAGVMAYYIIMLFSQYVSRISSFAGGM